MTSLSATGRLSTLDAFLTEAAPAITGGSGIAGLPVRGVAKRLWRNASNRLAVARDLLKSGEALMLLTSAVLRAADFTVAVQISVSKSA